MNQIKKRLNIGAYGAPPQIIKAATQGLKNRQSALEKKAQRLEQKVAKYQPSSPV